MSAPKFTPGPWECEVLPTLDGSSEFAIYLPEAAGGDFIPCIPGDRESEANARLIAAAPELYAALRAIAEPGCAWHGPPDGRCHRCSPCVARDALAKAEEVQP